MKRLVFFVIGLLAVLCSSTKGTIWSVMVPNTTQALNDVWGSAPDDVFAVGNNGTILHYDGDGNNDGIPDNIWEQMSSPTGNHLFGVFGSGSNDVYAVGGYELTMIHYNGIEWSLISDDLPLSDAQFLNDVWVSGSHVFAVGQGNGESHIFHWDGISWSHFSEDSPIAGAKSQLHYVWGRSSNDVYAVGHDGIGNVTGIMYHYDGSTWELRYPGGPVDFPLSNSGCIWGPSGSSELFFAGCTHITTYGSQYGQIIYYNGVSWEEPQIFTHSICLDSIWGNACDDIYVGARAGKILHYDGISWADMETGEDGYYGGLWGDGNGCMYAAGADITTNQALILCLQADNIAPVADTGDDQTYYAWIDGVAEVTLYGSDSDDPDGDELTYSWTWDGGSASGVNPTIELPVGVHPIELIVNDGTVDSEPDEVIITVIEPMEAQLWIFPQIIRRHRGLPEITTVVRLPEGVTKDQLDMDTLLLLYPGDIETTCQAAIQWCGWGTPRTSIIAFFNKADLMEAIPDNGCMELYVVGRLDTGRYFYGSDAIRIFGL